MGKLQGSGKWNGDNLSRRLVLAIVFLILSAEITFTGCSSSVNSQTPKKVIYLHTEEDAILKFQELHTELINVIDSDEKRSAKLKEKLPSLRSYINELGAVPDPPDDEAILSNHNKLISAETAIYDDYDQMLRFGMGDLPGMKRANDDFDACLHQFDHLINSQDGSN